MNERIKQLAEQAEDWADNQNFYESDYRDYLMEKFAELIVRKCVLISRTSTDGFAAGRRMEEHFGVKE
jgi:hypothetical protein